MTPSAHEQGASIKAAIIAIARCSTETFLYDVFVTVLQDLLDCQLVTRTFWLKFEAHVDLLEDDEVTVGELINALDAAVTEMQS